MRLAMETGPGYRWALNAKERKLKTNLLVRIS